MGTKEVIGSLLLRAQGQCAAADNPVRTAQQVDIIGIQRDETTRRKVAHIARFERQKRIFRQQVDLKITLSDFGRHIEPCFPGIHGKKRPPIRRPGGTCPTLAGLPARLIRVLIRTQAGIFCVDELALFLEGQVVILNQDNIARTMTGSRQGQRSNPGENWVIYTANRVFCLDEKVGVCSFDPMRRRVDQATIGDLNAHQA